MKVYLAGPMTGYDQLNFPHFHETAAALRAVGHVVVNPAELNVDTAAEWLACMRVDIAELIHCEAIALLDGWDKSRGARLEHQIATGLGYPAYCAYQLAKKPADTLVALTVRHMTKARTT